MARDAVNQAQKTYNTSADLTKSSTGNANNLYSTLIPTFSQEMTNPKGFDARTLTDMDTAAGESVGGGLGSAVGEADQLAASNRNFGGFAPALDEASRQASRQLSKNTQDIRTKNAVLKESQRQAGISGMTGLEDQQNADILSSLGLQNQSTNTGIEAGKSGWFQNMTGLLAAIKGNGNTAVTYNKGGGSGGSGDGGGSGDSGD